jgi:flagella basal body P-ring formation protein FlgA
MTKEIQMIKSENALARLNRVWSFGLRHFLVIRHYGLGIFRSASSLVIRRLVVGCWLLVVSPAFASEPSTNTPPAALAATNTLLDEAGLNRLLTAALQQQFVGSGGELDLRLTRPWVSRNVPEGPLTLRILDMPNNGVASSFIVRFEIFTADGGSMGNWQYPVAAHLWREIWVAQSVLKPGGLVADADIARERRDVLALHSPLAEFAQGDTTLEVAESVPAGSPLLAYSVKLHPVIHRGQMADALIQDGALNVTTKVQALEDGTPGKIIRLRNLLSNHDFSGKVLDGKTVLVAL